MQNRCSEQLNTQRLDHVELLVPRGLDRRGLLTEFRGMTDNAVKESLFYTISTPSSVDDV